MPEITRRDIMLLFVMALAIVSMSLVFPALGLADESVTASEIPEFSIEQDRFDVAGDFPNSPGTPTSGTMLYDASGEEFNNNQIWLEGGAGGGGYELVLLPNGDEGEVRINEWNSSSFVGYDSVNVSAPGDTATVERGGYEVNIEATDQFNGDNEIGVGYYEVTWEVVDHPGDGGELGERIPLVGTLIGGANALAGMVGWIASVLYWFGQTTFEVLLNVTGMLYDVTSYFTGLLTWMSTTYGAIVTSASGWVSVFVALPGIIFSAVLGKLVIIGIGLLPTT